MSKRPTAGFTLIEALTAIAVVALVLTVALQQVRESLAATRRVAAQSAALSVAQTKLAEVVTFERLADRDDEGVEAGDLLWQRRIRAVPEGRSVGFADRRTRLWQIEVDVRGRGGDAQISLVTMRAVADPP